MPETTPNPSLSIPTKFGLVTSGTIVAFLILEFFLRLTETKYIIPLNCYRSDETLNHVFIPNKTCQFRTREWDIIYKINSLGFRDKERTIEKPPNTFRILMLGDSYTEGWGVEGNLTFSSLLEAKFNSGENKSKFEVFNMGVSSYSPIIEYLLIKNLGLRLNPDLVILNFDYGDFSDENSYSQFAVFDEKGLPIAVKPQAPTHLTETLERLEKINANEIIFETNKPNPLMYFLAKKSLLIRRLIENRQNQPKNLMEIFDKGANSDWELPKKHLKFIKELLDKNGVGFIVTIFPHKQHLKNQQYQAVFAKMEEELGQKSSITLLNLFNTLQKENINSLYYKYDLHGNKKFHRILAESLYEYLTQNKLVR